MASFMVFQRELFISVCQTHRKEHVGIFSRIYSIQQETIQSVPASIWDQFTDAPGYKASGNVQTYSTVVNCESKADVAFDEIALNNTLIQRKNSVAHFGN